MNINDALGTNATPEAPAPTLPAPVLIDAAKLEADRDDVIVRMRSLEITDAAGRDIVVAFLTDEIKPMKDLIHASCDPVCDATNKAHKAATGQRKELLGPLSEAEKIGKEKVGTWDLEQLRLRQIEEQRIEKQRLADEAQRKRDEAEAEAEASKNAAAALAEAEALMDAGDLEGAEAALEKSNMTQPVALEEPFIQPPPVADPGLQPASTQGVSTRFTYAVEVTSLSEFLQGVIDKKIPTKLVSIEFGKLNKQANAMDGELNYPGIRMTRKPIVSLRGKK